MKKVLLLFALVAISVVSINAQDNLKWGVMAGMNVSKYTITGFDSRIGFHAGVKAEVGLSQDANGSGAYMDFAALLTLKGAKIDGGSVASLTFNPYYLEVPKPTKLVYPKPCLKSIQTGGFSLQTPGGMRHLRAERVRNAGICNNFEGPAPLLQNVPGMGETVGFSTQIHIRQFDVGENCKRCVVPHQKIVIFPT